MPKHTDLKTLPGKLLAWFDRHRRDLAWRSPPGVARDPYAVWLAEIMLQQTTIPHGTPYFIEFTRRWPTVEALAAARDEDVMAAWAGLGYYARARNLLKCAREVAALGGFPETEADLRKLPGIGPYTAGAIAALAFGERAAAVDGNVDRVFARLLALEGDWKAAKKIIHATVAGLVPADRPGDFAEALMDLGATVCTPAKPNCAACPLKTLCSGARGGAPEAYPVKPAKAAKPERTGVAYVALQSDKVLLVRRPQRGLLGGMLALPTTGWIEGDADGPPFEAGWETVGEVRHVFTHFSLRLSVARLRLDAGMVVDGQWVALDGAHGLPSVFAKALALATR